MRHAHLDELECIVRAPKRCSSRNAIRRPGAVDGHTKSVAQAYGKGNPPDVKTGIREQDRINGRPFDHRRYVGGLWHELGALQLNYLVSQGLRRDHTFLDVGCGALRGGIRFIAYLEANHYFGLDIDEELLEAGRRELVQAGFADGAATLLRDDAFRFERFGRVFDVALAHSVFTHLRLDSIVRCLGEVEKVLAPDGRFFATFFASPGPRLRTESLPVSRGITTHVDADPFYYDPDIFRWLVEGSTLRCEIVGEWGHPRNQQMLVFSKTDG
jgi:SAM-dependent methyltransferase